MPTHTHAAKAIVGGLVLWKAHRAHHVCMNTTALRNAMPVHNYKKIKKSYFRRKETPEKICPGI
jgi:hypothetical protein